MSKKKNKRRAERPKNRRSDPFLDFDEEEDFDDEAVRMELSRHALDEEIFPVEDERYPFDEPRFQFDFDRWRDDLTERSSRRERMRQRDLKKGILRGTRIRQVFLDSDMEDLDD